MSKIKKILIIVAVVILAVLAVQVINAEKYKMVVNVVEGENVLGVNPLTEKLDFGDLSRNNGMTRYITLQSGGSTPAQIFIWKFGEIAELVKIDKTSFAMEPGQEVKLSFTISIPPSAETKQYTGNVWIFRLPKLF